MKKIVFIIDSLEGGGTQNFLINLTNFLTDTSDFQIHILSFLRSNNTHFGFSNNVKVNFMTKNKYQEYNSDLFSKIKKNLQKIFFLRKKLISLNPNMCISFIGTTNVLFVISVIGLKFKTIISERNNPKKQSLGFNWNILRFLFYRKADIVTVNSLPAYNILSQYINKKKLFFLPNFIKIHESKKVIFETKNQILAIGRLENQKNYFFMIKVFSFFVKKFPNYNLKILGKGSLKDKLIEYANFLNINDNIEFVGYVKNPNSYFLSSDFLIMTSYYEGMPNIILESLSLSLPAIVNSSFSNSISFYKKFNNLVFEHDNEIDLLNKMHNLANDKKLREFIGSSSRSYILKYNEESKKYWKNFIDKNVI